MVDNLTSSMVGVRLTLRKMLRLWFLHSVFELATFHSTISLLIWMNFVWFYFSWWNWNFWSLWMPMPPSEVNHTLKMIFFLIFLKVWEKRYIGQQSAGFSSFFCRLSIHKFILFSKTQFFFWAKKTWFSKGEGEMIF